MFQIFEFGEFAKFQICNLAIFLSVAFFCVFCKNTNLQNLKNSTFDDFQTMTKNLRKEIIMGKGSGVTIFFKRE